MSNKNGQEFLRLVRRIISEVAESSLTPGKAARVTAFGILTLLDPAGGNVGTPEYRLQVKRGWRWENVEVSHDEL